MLKFILHNFPYKMIECTLHVWKDDKNIYKIADHNNC